MNETTKSKKYWGPIERIATSGRGIDIGCGPDPVTSDVRKFDINDGDANKINESISEEYNFVYSSHCLEHMHDPKEAIKEWWKLVKPGGYLFIVVPDEDLYEQGVFPSRFNSDHKATFTISKSYSWSARSINVLDLAMGLPGGQIRSLELQDRGYDRSLASFGILPRGLWIRAISKLLRIVGVFDQARIRRFFSAYYPVDQTTASFDAQAQIQLIVEKMGQKE